jgi:hypothetical protein
MSEEQQQSAPADSTPGESAPEAASEPAPSFMRRLFAKKLNLVIIIAVVVIVIGAAVGLGAMGGGGGLFSKKAAAPPLVLTEQSGAIPTVQVPQVKVGQTAEIPISFNGTSGGTNSSKNQSAVTNIIEVTVSCKWKIGRAHV